MAEDHFYYQPCGCEIIVHTEYYYGDGTVIIDAEIKYCERHMGQPDPVDAADVKWPRIEGPARIDENILGSDMEDTDAN